MNHHDEIQSHQSARFEYRHNGPDIFPDMEITHRSDMKRIAVCCAVQNACVNISAWGPGAVRTKKLGSSIGYYYRPQCVPQDTYDEVFKFIASWFPSGLEADISQMTRKELKEFMSPCIDSAKAHEARYRKRVKR